MVFTTNNQIDFIHIYLMFKTNISKAKTKTFPGAGIEHDI